MAEQAISERPIVVARPRFVVQGAQRQELAEDLIRLETTEDEFGIAQLEAVFLNWGRRTEDSEPGYVYFSGDLVDLGREIVVRAGDEDNEETVFRGLVTAVEGAFPELRPPEIIVRAEDRLQWMRMRRRSRRIEDSSDSDIAEQLSTDHGLARDTQADGPVHDQLWQVNQSDLSFLRERARAVDARIAASEGRLVFRPRREAGGEPIRLSRENELLRFNVSADLTHQRAEVRVHGYSVAGKEGIHETAGAAQVGADDTGPGRTGPEVLAAIKPDAVDDVHLEFPATAEEASSVAKSYILQRARRFVTARGVTIGIPALHVGSRVDIVDVGPWFSGVYYVSVVAHTFNQNEGLRTHFVAERTKIGGGE